MAGVDFASLSGFLLVVALASAMGTWLALAYARRRALYDLPGQRRSHVSRTPRGGGIAPVLVFLIATPLLALNMADVPASLWWLLGSTALVAAISWVDDHRSLPILPRIAVHLLAAVLLVLGALGVGDDLPAIGQRLLLVVALVLATNFWNFMDGIDGIAVMQSAVTAALLAMAAWLAQAPPVLLPALVLLAALVGFAPFNLPKARIFLGDVGSTTLGFGLAGIGVLGLAEDSWGWALWPMAAAPFMIDAGLTLLSRLLRGVRWYNPHREHLYQWLHRSGLSHPRVVAIYLACNLLLVVPSVLLLLQRPQRGVALWIALWLLLSIIWLLSRHALLRRVKRGRPE